MRPPPQPNPDVVVFVDIWKSKTWTMVGERMIHKDIPAARAWALARGSNIKLRLVPFKETANEAK